MNQSTTGSVGALGLVALAIFCPMCHRVPIEQYLKSQSEAALKREGLIARHGQTDWSVEVEGLDVYLYGPPAEGSLAQAFVQRELAPQIPWFFDIKLLGLRRIKPPSVATPTPTPVIAPRASPTPVAAPRPTPTPPVTGKTTGLVQLLSNGSTNYLRGVYPDEASRQKAVVAIRLALGGEIKDETTLSGEGGALGWPEQALKTLSVLKSVRNLELSAGGDVLTISGTVASAAEREKLAGAMKADLPPGVMLENQLTLPGQTRRVPEPSASTALPVAERQKAQSRINPVVGSGEVLFATASSRIKAEAYPYLNQVAEALKGQSAATVTVGGHTDGEGDAEDNRRLSQKRADSVRAYLITRGVPSLHLFSRGYGSSQPLASNATEEGRRRNRRIGFTVH